MRAEMPPAGPDAGAAPWWLPICGVAIAAEALALLAWTVAAAARSAGFCKKRGQGKAAAAQTAEHAAKLAAKPDAATAAALIDGSGTQGGGHLVVVNAEPCVPRGLSSKSNAPKPCPFDTGTCHGCYVVLHRPTDDPKSFSAGAYPYADHMHGRRRLWEFRLQITCRETIDGEIFFGCEQDRYYYINPVERVASKSVISLLRSAAAEGMYQSHGDDPSTTKGEPERPGIVFPLWVMDQVVVTPAGEQPPDLCGPDFATLGHTKATDRKAYRQVIDSLEFKPGCTFSFGFWCIAQFVDGVNWCVPARGLMPRIRLNDVGTHPPCYIAMYALQPPPAGTQGRSDTRHLDSRKRYLWRIAFWSSLRPPDQQRERELVASGPEDLAKPEVGQQRPWRCCCGGG